MKLHLRDTGCTSLAVAIWDHTVLPSARHKWTHPTLTPVLDLRTPEDGRPSWPRWPQWLHTEMVYPHTHPSTNLTAHGRESNSRPVDHKSDALTTTPPSQYCSTVITASDHIGVSRPMSASNLVDAKMHFYSRGSSVFTLMSIVQNYFLSF